jgi:hypothetical protein
MGAHRVAAGVLNQRLHLLSAAQHDCCRQRVDRQDQLYGAGIAAATERRSAADFGCYLYWVAIPTASTA